MGITDTSTGETADMHKQGLSKEEQIKKAKLFFESRAQSRFYHPTSDSILHHMSVHTDDQDLYDEMMDYIRLLSRKRRFS